MLFFAMHTGATHIVGGEVNYRYIGNNKYEITLKVYRDCYNGIAPFDNPAQIGIFNDDFSLYAEIAAYISEQGPIPNAINSPCLTPPTNICFEYAKYVFTTTIAPSSTGYTIGYQRCCRNSSVVNVDNVQSTGATFVAFIPDTGLAAVNSNPVFNELPPTFLCLNAPFTYDHSATDPDGDQLVYSVTTPYSGGTRSNPAPFPTEFTPIVPIIWNSPYDENNPFGSSPLTIDPVSGIMQVTPSSLGQFVYGICVSEYRNGNLISQTIRDFEVNVVPCPDLTVASIPSPTIACGTLQADFINNSYNAASYS